MFKEGPGRSSDIRFESGSHWRCYGPAFRVDGKGHEVPSVCLGCSRGDVRVAFIGTRVGVGLSEVEGGAIVVDSGGVRDG